MEARGSGLARGRSEDVGKRNLDMRWNVDKGRSELPRTSAGSATNTFRYSATVTHLVDLFLDSSELTRWWWQVQRRCQLSFRGSALSVCPSRYVSLIAHLVDLFLHGYQLILSGWREW